MKICEHTKSIANTNWWVSQLKRMFFFFSLRIKMEKVSLVYLFIYFPAFCYLSTLSLFYVLLSFLLHFDTCILRKSVSLFLSLFRFQVINKGFLNEMWYKGLIQGILRCGFFFFFFLRKLKIWWFDWISCHFSFFTLWETVRNNLFLLNFQLEA